MTEDAHTCYCGFMREEGKIAFSQHALFQMRARGIPKADVLKLLQNPDKTSLQYTNRYRAESKITQHKIAYRYCVLFERSEKGKEVITVYRLDK